MFCIINPWCKQFPTAYIILNCQFFSGLLESLWAVRRIFIRSILIFDANVTLMAYAMWSLSAQRNPSKINLTACNKLSLHQFKLIQFLQYSLLEKETIPPPPPPPQKKKKKKKKKNHKKKTKKQTNEKKNPTKKITNKNNNQRTNKQTKSPNTSRFLIYNSIQSTQQIPWHKNKRIRKRLQPISVKALAADLLQVETDKALIWFGHLACSIADFGWQYASP